jgi:hypothetical protein
MVAYAARVLPGFEKAIAREPRAPRQNDPRTKSGSTGASALRLMALVLTMWLLKH